MSKLIKKAAFDLSVLELQLLKFLDNGNIYTYSEIAKNFSDWSHDRIDECLEKFRFHLYIKQLSPTNVIKEKYFVIYIISTDLRDAIKAVKSYKTAKNDLEIMQNHYKNLFMSSSDFNCNWEHTPLANFFLGNSDFESVKEIFNTLFKKNKKLFGKNTDFKQLVQRVKDMDNNTNTTIETTENQTIVATTDLQVSENQTIELKETVHYTHIDFKQFKKENPHLNNEDLATEYVYNVAKEQFLRTENEIQDGEGKIDFLLYSGNLYINHMCMGNGFLCEALIEMTPKKQMIRLEIRKFYYDNLNSEFLNQKHGFTNEFEPVIFQKQNLKTNLKNLNMKGQFIHMSKHNFGKVNLITTKKGDEYKCNDCGCKGFRDGLRPYIIVKNRIDMSICPKRQYQRPVKVQIIGNNGLQWGLENNSIHTVIDSPEPKYKNEVWVFSEKRNEPVRLLDGEFVRVTDEPLETFTDEPTTAKDEPLETFTDEPTTAKDEPLATITDEPLETVTIELTEMENRVLMCFINELNDYDYGFSDIICHNLVKPTGLKMNQIKGVIGSLTKKGLVFTDDMDTKHDLIFLDEKAYSLHNEWKQHAKTHLEITISKDAKTEMLDTLPDTLATEMPDTLPDTLATEMPDTLPDTLATEIPDTLATEMPDTLAKAKAAKNDKEDNMIKTALSETLKKVNTANSEIMRLCNLSKSELSEFKAEKRSTSLNRALEIACNLNMTSHFLELLNILIKRKITAFTESKKKNKNGLHIKQLSIF